MKKTRIVSLLMAFVMVLAVAIPVAASARNNDTLPITLPNGVEISLSDVLAMDMTAPPAFDAITQRYAYAHEVTEIFFTELSETAHIAFNEGEIVETFDGSRGKIVVPENHGFEVTMIEIEGDLTDDEVIAFVTAGRLDYLLQDVDLSEVLSIEVDVEVEPFSCFIHVWVQIGWAFGRPLVMCLNCGGTFILV